MSPYQQPVRIDSIRGTSNQSTEILSLTDIQQINLMGFHNAPWRSAFGGDIYLTNGSHGCINLSYEKADELYSLCNVGDVVIIHE